MSENNVLNFGWVHIFSARDNHVFESVLNPDESFIIGKGNVAGIQPTIFDRVSGGVWSIPIARHDVVSAHENFASFFR